MILPFFFFLIFSCFSTLREANMQVPKVNMLLSYIWEWIPTIHTCAYTHVQIYACMHRSTNTVSLHRQLLKFIWYLGSFFAGRGDKSDCTVLYTTSFIVLKKHAFTLSCFLVISAVSFGFGCFSFEMKFTSEN